MTSGIYTPVSFNDIDGWARDSHASALAAFADCAAALERRAIRPGAGPQVAALARLSVAAGDAACAGEAGSRAFFEGNFLPHRVVHNHDQGREGGLLTGYFEPVLAGARQATERFHVALLRRPADLVNLIGDELRGASGQSLTHGCRVGEDVAPFATRSEIEQGALDGRGLEMFYLADPVDAFFLHVQGSGVIALPTGERIRVGYDGKNGHPYRSIGRYLIEAGLMALEDMTLDRLGAWLRADTERGRRTMRLNKSFIFFKELGPADATRSHGVDGIPLTAGRSLAVDASQHEIGSPVFVVSPSLGGVSGDGGFRRLMIAQDVGSAITGPERGDIFFGCGEEAGQRAGTTNNRGNFFVLLPRETATQ